MARSASPLLLVVGLGVVVVVAVVLMLVLLGGEAELGGGGAVTRSRDDSAPAMDLPEPVAGGDTAPLRGQREAPAGADRPMAPAAADAPVDVRRVTAVLVRRSDGRPLAGATVWAHAAPPDDAVSMIGLPLDHTAPVDAAGAVVLDHAPLGVASLVIDPDGHGGNAAWVALPLPEGDADLDLGRVEVDTGWLVTGRVRDRSGAPVPDARVWIGFTADDDVRPSGMVWGTSGFRPLASAAAVTTDGAGFFALPDVRPDGDGRLELRAVAEYHAPDSLPLALPDDTRRVDGLLLELAAAGAIAGRVTLSDGRPVHGARVDAPWGLDDGYVGDAPFEFSDATDVDGAYALHGVPAGRYVVFLRRGERSWSSQVPRPFPRDGADVRLDVDVVEGRTTPVDFVLPDGARVAGRVTDRAGNPVQGAAVEVEWELTVPAHDRPGSWISIVRGGRSQSRVGPDGKVSAVAMPLATRPADPDGRYVFTDLPAGRLVLTALPDPERPLPGRRVRAARREVELMAGQSLDGVDLTLGAGLGLEGRVVDASGRPLLDASAAVTAAGPSYLVGSDDFLQVDDTGRFAFEGVEPGTFLLHVRCAGYRDWSQAIEAGDPPVLVEMLTAPTISGRVRDGATLEPVARYTLQVDSPSLHMTAEWSHDEGRFLIDSLDEGAYTLTVSADGYVPWVGEGLELRFDAPLELDVLLNR